MIWDSILFCFVSRISLDQTSANLSSASSRFSYTIFNIQQSLLWSCLSFLHDLCREHSYRALLCHFVLPSGYPDVLVITAEQVVPVLPLGHTVINKPGNHNVLGWVSLAIVNGLENAPAPLAIPLYPVLVGGFVRTWVGQEAFLTDILEVNQTSLGQFWWGL